MCWVKKKNRIGSTEDERKINEEFIKILENDLEIEKQQSEITRSQGNYNIVTLTLLSPILTTITIELLDKLKGFEKTIIIFSGIIMLILFVSIFFATLTHFIYKQAYPANPEVLLKNINKKREFYTKDGFIEQKKYDLMEMYKSTRKNNENRKLFLRISFIGIWAFMLMMVIFGIVIYIKVIDGGNRMIEEKEKIVRNDSNEEEYSKTLGEGELKHSEIISESESYTQDIDISVGNDDVAPVEIRYEKEPSSNNYDNNDNMNG